MQYIILKYYKNLKSIDLGQFIYFLLICRVFSEDKNENKKVLIHKYNCKEIKMFFSEC